MRRAQAFGGSSPSASVVQPHIDQAPQASRLRGFFALIPHVSPTLKRRKPPSRGGRGVAEARGALTGERLCVRIVLALPPCPPCILRALRVKRLLSVPSLPEATDLSGRVHLLPSENRRWRKVSCSEDAIDAKRKHM
jgi:hypothetical protein